MKFINSWNNISIVWKLFIAFSGILVMISVFIYSYFPSKLEEKALNEITVKGKTITELLSYNLSPALFFDDPESASEGLVGVKQNEDLHFIVLLDKKQAIFEGLEIPNYKQLIAETPKLTEGISENGELFITKQPVIQQGKQIGTLIGGFSLAKLNGEIKDIRNLVALICLGILLLGMGLSFAISRVLTQPLGHMVSVMNKVRKGELGVRAKIRRKDELGVLAESFNEMIGEIQSSSMEIQKREIQFRTLAETINEGLLQFDKDGNVLFGNNRFKNMFGWQEDDLTQLNITQIFPEHGLELLPQEEESVDARITQNEFELARKNGKMVDVLVSSAPELDSEQKVARFNAIFTDISKLKSTEKQLLFKNRELDIFVYKASHDLKAPLTSMKGLTQMAISETKDESALMFLGMIQKSIDKLFEVLLGLMEIARMREGMAKLERIHLNDLVNSKIEDLAHMNGFSEIELVQEVPPHIEIVADRTLLGSAIQNLISNAIKYHRTSGEDRIIRVKYQQDDGGFNLAIEDNGPGIPADSLGSLFDMFYRGNSSVEGTGLGLYIVKTGIEKMGGTIRVLSNVNVGTSFIISIPNHVFQPA